MRVLSKESFDRNLENNKNKIFPIFKEVIADIETPVSAFLKLREKRSHIYLLESIEGNSNIGRYSFIGLDAHTIFIAKKGKIEIKTFNEKENKFSSEEIVSENPLCELENLVKNFESNIKDNLDLPPFYGGAVGYIGYDSICYFEKSLLKKLKSSKDDLNYDDMYFVFPKDIVIFDRVKNTISIISNVFISDKSDKDYEKGLVRISNIENEIFFNKNKSNIDLLEGKNNLDENLKIFPKQTHSKEDYMNMVIKAKDYIKKGDIFQIVLSQRWEIELTEDLNKKDDFDIYRYLRVMNPSPYMFYLKFDDLSIIGASPEILAKRMDNKLLVRPIAGTRKRGATYDIDKALEEELLNDKKECAEHIMLVDLGRNDIGRVVKNGTVKIDDYMTIEKYSHVMHIVSQVSGEVSADTKFSDIMKSVFPAGTVSGAPKIRAMEIIDELENKKRGIYAGTIVYLGFKNNFDSCITIRTILKKGNKIYMQAGAGIVADSDPETEYFETLGKSKAMLDAIAKSLGASEISVK
jgi:anthranilate synthase component I